MSSEIVSRPTPQGSWLKYLRVWRQLAIMSFSIQTGNPLSSTGYLLGKLLRLGFFLLFLSAIFQHTRALRGYSLEQAALFFLTFNIIDILAQLLFRGIYSIRGLIREGDFDYFLIQPINTLYRVAFNTVDFLDVVAILPVFFITLRMMLRIPGTLSFDQIAGYLFLVLNGMLIALAIHIAVAALAVWTQEMENSIWFYRDLMTLGRFPVDIYDSWLRNVLTFVMPIAVMVSFPVKAFLGLLSPRWFMVAVAMSTMSVTVSLAFWRFAMRRYTSVSS